VAVLESQKQDISVLVGQTLSEQFDCFLDDDHTIPFDLTGYTLQATLNIPSLGEDAAVTLTPGSGMTVDAANGIVALTCPTDGWKVGRGSWHLQATDASNEISYPLRGVLYVGNP